jgi:hypothetical protein
MDEKDRCGKHPDDYLGLNPEEFVEERFGGWNGGYKKGFFSGLEKEYAKQSKGDRERGRVQLSGGLENLSKACYEVSKGIIPSGKVKEAIRPGKAAEIFGFTTYFYQQKCFELMEPEMPGNFGGVLRSINQVCKACKKYMKNSS